MPGSADAADDLGGHAGDGEMEAGGDRPDGAPGAHVGGDGRDNRRGVDLVAVDRELVARAAPRCGPAIASSSIAACASYETCWRTPSSELTASNSRPMLDVGTQCTSAFELAFEHGELTRRGRTYGGESRPSGRRPPKVRERGAVRLADRRVAAGQRHVAQVRDPLEAGVGARRTSPPQIAPSVP